jgi:hypothetical protein
MTHRGEKPYTCQQCNRRSNVFAEDDFAELLPEGWIMRNNIQFHIIWLREGLKKNC